MWLKRLFYKRLPNSCKDWRGLVNSGGQYRVRKRGTLEEDSSLRLKGIDMLHVNLSRLVGKKSCTILYTLFHNKY